MGDYRYLVAIMPEKCAMCRTEVSTGKPIYVEIGKHDKFCRTCGRVIRVHGEEMALMVRLSGKDVDHLFKD